MVSIKALAHWITTGVPLVLVSPVLGLLLNLPVPAYGWLLFFADTWHAGTVGHRHVRLRR